MAESNSSVLPPPSPEHRRAAAGQFDRANQVIATGNFDYGIRLLVSCCKLDPANLLYRQMLRRTEKARFKNNLRGSRFAWLTTWSTRARLKAARQSRDHLRLLEYGEDILTRNPWDIPTQMDMAAAADTLGLLDMAIWILEQARQKNPKDVKLNRSLARLYEKRGNFTHAIALWELVRKAEPTDVEAQHKAKDLAATETIARGNYETGGGRSPMPAAETLPEAPAAPAPGAPARSAPTDSVKKDRQKTVPKAAPAPPAADRTARDAAPLRARIEADPGNPIAYLQLAAVYRRADQLEQAREVLQQGLAPTGNHFDLALELADLDIEPFRRNLKITEEKLLARPGDEGLLKIRTGLLREINARELDLYRRKADRYPTELVHRYEVGVRLFRAGQTDEAIRELQAARADVRHQWRALLCLGHCFKSRHNWRLAERNFEEALKGLPAGEERARKEILFELAQGAADAGDLQKAIDRGSDLANVDFAYRDIGRLLDDWQGRLEQADVSG